MSGAVAPASATPQIPAEAFTTPRWSPAAHHPDRRTRPEGTSRSPVGPPWLRPEKPRSGARMITTPVWGMAEAADSPGCNPMTAQPPADPNAVEPGELDCRIRLRRTTARSAGGAADGAAGAAGPSSTETASMASMGSSVERGRAKGQMRADKTSGRPGSNRGPPGPEPGALPTALR